MIAMKRIDMGTKKASQVFEESWMKKIYSLFKSDNYTLGKFFNLQGDLGLQMNELDIPANRHEIIKDALID